MAFGGQVLHNPVSGERFVFHTTAGDNAGRLLEFDLVVEPHGRVPGGHVHPGQQESFEVREGIMKFRKGLRTVTAGPGDLIVVEPGTFHRFANVGDEPAVVRVRVEPALRMEELFETVAALAAEGRTLPSGMPRPLDLALFMREFAAEVAAPVAPGVARAVMAPLAAIGERRGLGERYRRYHQIPVEVATGQPGDASFPLFVFVFLVALGIDYNIFLMTRVREEAARSGPRRGALTGLAMTGGVITSAGAVLAGTFAVLGTLPLTFPAEIGFAVAFGVLLDTMVVRSVLVTALNLDLGRWVWWPGRLSREPARREPELARLDPEPPTAPTLRR